MRLKEMAQFTNVWNKIGDTATDPTAIKRLIIEYYEQLHTYKLNNIEKRPKTTKAQPTWNRQLN